MLALQLHLSLLCTVQAYIYIALSLKGKVKWWENVEQCLDGLGWSDVRLDSVKGMSNAEVKYMLKNYVWREVNKMRAEESEEQPKICLEEDLRPEVWERGERQLEEY